LSLKIFSFSQSTSSNIDNPDLISESSCAPPGNKTDTCHPDENSHLETNIRSEQDEPKRKLEEQPKITNSATDVNEILFLKLLI